MSEIKRTLEWFKQAMPEPTHEQACIQVGCHYEEVSEMMEVLVDDEVGLDVELLAKSYKELGSEHVDFACCLDPQEREQLLDSLADQIVTAIGVCHTMGFDIEGALAEVNRSNFSKFEDGTAVFDENGKIAKGERYSKPDLKPYT